MLIEFGVKNFRSIKDKMTLSLLASSDHTHEDQLILEGNKRLLPVAVLYGANASGKSNLLRALQTMQDMVSGKSAQILKDKKLPYDCFKFTSIKEMPTEFEVFFFYQGIRYNYGFSYTDKEILKEYLYYWPKGREALIFSRDNGKYLFRENITEQETLAARTPSNRLYLVASNSWNLPQTENAYRWFNENLSNPDEQDTPDITISMETEKAKILNELLLADLGITQYGINETGDKPNVLMVHQVKENMENEKYPLPLENESAGTQRFFARIGPWLHALNEGRILIIDELEASLHPLLTRRLVEMMQDPSVNTKGAQLLFTTHDVMLLDLSLLRRDQIWFTEKNPDTAATEVYSLWEFSPRKNENIRNGYLQGRFGAVPFLGGDFS